MFNELPEYPDDIAKYFELQGIKGVRGAISACPVAQYLRKNGFKNIEVSHSFCIGQTDDHNELKAMTPRHVAVFMHKFDEGKYVSIDIDANMSGYGQTTI